jgi:hypothetical protein
MKGWGADETKAAFKRTGDVATGAGFASERFLALYGQCTWSLVRGDIRSARKAAEQFLCETEVEGRVGEIGVARRLLGLACLILGDLVNARDHLEWALNTYDRERDNEIRERFTHDTGVAAAAYLALATWLSGDLERTGRLIAEAIRLSDDLGHLPNLIHALWYKVLVECFGNHPERVAVDAETLLTISQQHGVEFFVCLADVALSWARGRLGDARSRTLPIAEPIPRSR